MKHILFLIAIALLLCIQSHAQNVAINNDGSEPDPSAALDVKASDKGVLIPRVDFNNLPLSPATGLLVYVTANGPDGNNAFYYYNGTQWQNLPTSAGIVNSQWTTVGSDIYYNTGNVGIGNASPHAPLQFVNTSASRKIVFYEVADNDHQFFGFGTNSGILRYQLPSTTSNHVFYAGASESTSNELFRIKGTGQIAIPALTTAGVLINNTAGEVSSSIGTNGQVLSTNGSGGVGWTTPATPTNLWESNGADVYRASGNVGIGVSTPHAPLQFINTSASRKIVFYEVADNDHQFFGFGTNSGILRYQVPTITSNHVFFAGTSDLESSELFRIKGDGDVVAQGQIKNVTDPTDAQDAATKAYVDNRAKNYEVGDFALGGVVFWVDESGQHGLVCAKQDQSTGVRWYAGTYGNTQAKGDGPYAGEANTSIIVAAQVAIGDDGSTYAARICNELQITESDKTYGDWYLPSKAELNMMYQNKATIDATATSNGGSGFAGTYYWSSTEQGTDYAYAQYFDIGNQYYDLKNSTGRVRAIRAF
jgi:hypothetical protein